MTEREPAVSRLCIAAAARDSSPLHRAIAAGHFYRMHLTTDPADGTELAIAAPGLDEVSLIADMIDALRDQAMGADEPGSLVLAGFHVGLVRLMSSTFCGNGITRVRALLRHPAIVERLPAPGRVPGGKPWLFMVITAGLFDDLRAEGLPADDWQHVAVAEAWLRGFSCDRETRAEINS